jgi:MFS family permease
MALEDAHATASSFYGVSGLVTVVATLIGGALALAIGPRLTAAGGLALSMLALALAALTGGSSALLLVSTFGSGMARPCAYAFAAEAIAREGDDSGHYAPSPRRFAATACFASIALIVINGAAFFSPLFASFVSGRVGYRTTAALTAVGMLVAGALFGASVLADPMRPPPSDATPANTAYRTAPGGAAPGAATSNAPLIALALALPLAAMAFTERFVDVREQNVGGGYAFRTIGVNIDIIVTIIAAACAAGLFFGLTSKRSPVPIVLFLGIGFIAAGIAPLFWLAGVPVVGLLGTALGALAEPFTFLVIVYAALSVRGRVGTLVAGGAMSVQTLGSVVAAPLSVLPSAVMIVLGALFIMVSGVVVIVLQRIFSADSPG